MPRLTLPPIGLGTNPNTGERCRRAVETAIEVGYRHIDTAQMYDNESAVGDGIARSSLPREELTVATKVHPANLAYDDVLESTADSLDRLGLDSVDILYVHWPTDAYDPDATLRAFDELYERGDIGAVGVSNFSPEQIETAIDRLSAPLVANQVELHPLLPQDEVRAFAREHDLTVVAYSPILKGNADDVPALVDIAEKHDVTPTQVCLAWVTGLDSVVAIPKATSERHLRDNLAAADISLDGEDRDRIASIDREERLVTRPGAPWT